MMGNPFDERAEQVRQNIMQIKQNMYTACQDVGRDPAEVQLMAVTKTVPAELVNIAIQEGITLLGENRAQELLQKYDVYTAKDQIHFIGHLQRNKVKSIIDKVCMIESVGSVELADEIEKQAAKHGLIMPCLVEVNIGKQASKSGVMPEQAAWLIQKISSYAHLSVQGLMSIPPIEGSAAYFEKLHQLYIDIKQQNIDNVNMHVLSMGMSADYAEAIRHGSTLIRIGTAMFGKRN